VATGSYSVCNNVSVCQTMTNGYQSTYNLGTIDSADFVYRNSSVIIVYQSGGPSYNNRKLSWCLMQMKCLADLNL